MSSGPHGWLPWSGASYGHGHMEPGHLGSVQLDLPIIMDACSQILGHFLTTAGCGPGQVMLAAGEGQGPVLKGTLSQGVVAEDAGDIWVLEALCVPQEGAQALVAGHILTLPHQGVGQPAGGQCLGEAWICRDGGAGRGEH